MRAVRWARPAMMSALPVGAEQARSCGRRRRRSGGDIPKVPVARAARWRVGRPKRRQSRMTATPALRHGAQDRPIVLRRAQRAVGPRGRARRRVATGSFSSSAARARDVDRSISGPSPSVKRNWRGQQRGHRGRRIARLHTTSPVHAAQRLGARGSASHAERQRPEKTPRAPVD